MTRTTLAVLLLALPLSPVEAAKSPSTPTTAATIDFQGFLEVSQEVARVRPERLLSLDDFLALAAEPDTLLLDTRSAAAYAAKHLAGAVHLNLSDVTEESLAGVLGPSDRTVLIYCNNNFSDNRRPFMKKKAMAALNIPTFVSLWVYGYQEVYELGELLEQSDPRLRFEGALVEEGSADG